MQIIEKIKENLVKMRKDYENLMVSVSGTDANVGILHRTLMLDEVIKMVDMVEKEENDDWIPCEVQMPPEKEDVFRYKDPLTDVDIEEKYMASDLVQVTVIDTDTDEKFVTDDCTRNGKWCTYYDEFEVIAWRPLPKPYQPKEEKEQR